VRSHGHAPAPASFRNRRGRKRGGRSSRRRNSGGRNSGASAAETATAATTTAGQEFAPRGFAKIHEFLVPGCQIQGQSPIAGPKLHPYSATWTGE